MKKLMTILVGLSLAMGTVSPAFAADTTTKRKHVKKTKAKRPTIAKHKTKRHTSRQVRTV